MIVKDGRCTPEWKGVSEKFPHNKMLLVLYALLPERDQEFKRVSMYKDDWHTTYKDSGPLFHSKAGWSQLPPNAEVISWDFLPPELYETKTKK